MPKILVIDSDTESRQWVRSTLELAGHEVAEAPTAQVGLSAMQQWLVDVALCDLYLPDRSGYQVLQRMKSEAVPVVAMAGRWSHVSPRQMLDVAVYLGAAATLEKPFTAEDLLAAVSAALQRSI